MDKLKDKRIKIRYNPIKSEESQRRIDNAFDFIFDKVFESYPLANLQTLSHTYNNLGGKNEKRQSQILHRSTGFKKITNPLANHPLLHQKQKIKSS